MAKGLVEFFDAIMRFSGVRIHALLLWPAVF